MQTDFAGFFIFREFYHTDQFTGTGFKTYRIFEIFTRDSDPKYLQKSLDFSKFSLTFGVGFPILNYGDEKFHLLKTHPKTNLKTDSSCGMILQKKKTESK